MSSGKTLKALAIALITWSIGCLVWVVSQRLVYPFALEWMEGGMLQHADRIRQGLPLYGAPSPDFTPFPYPPLFPWLASLLPGDSWSFVGPRLLALSGYVGVAGCLWWIARKMGIGALWAGMGVAVWAGGFAFGGGWFDVARADGWALFLHLAGVCCLWGEGGRKRAVAAGVLFLLSGLAKQIGWPMGVLCTLAYTWQGKPGLVQLWGTMVFGTFALFMLLPSLFGDWAYFYIFEVLAGHPTHLSVAALGPVIGKVGLGSILAVWVLYNVFRGPDKDHGQAPMLLALWLGWAVVFLMGAVHAGAYDNVYLPILLASAFGVMLAGGIVARLRDPWKPLSVAVLGLCVVQMGLLTYDPRGWIPTEEYTARCRSIENVIAQGEGEMFAPGHGYLLERQGVAGGFHWMALFDLSASGDGALGRSLVEAVERRFQQGLYKAAIADRLTGPGGSAMDMGSWVGGFFTGMHALRAGSVDEAVGKPRELARDGRSPAAPPSGAPWRPLPWYSDPVLSSE